MLQAAEPELVLASESATRLRLLRDAGLVVTAEPARLDESAIKAAARAEGQSAMDAAMALADLKAVRVARRRPQALVIGADQLLVCGDRWFDKPADPAGACAQLRDLRGKSHLLVTAIVCRRGETRVWQHVEQPRLTMREISDPFLDAYLATEADAASASVGGYRLEGLGVQLFAAIAGDYFSILGLPLLPLLDFLRQHGVLGG